MTMLPFSTVAFVQFAIEPGRPERNVQTVVELLAQNAPLSQTLLVLPEMWATGFDYPRTEELAAQTPALLEQLRVLAARYTVFFAGSLAEQDSVGSLPHNTLFLVGPTGVIGRLPKQHLFSAWQEDSYYKPGQDCVPMETEWGPVGGLVCYDLRFPEVAREQAFSGVCLLLVSAQWPMARLGHWQVLLKARAIENQVYVVAANGCGKSGEIELAGHSMVVAPDGTVLQEAGDTPLIAGAELDGDFLKTTRRRFCPPGERPWRKNDARKIVSLPVLQDALRSIGRQGGKIAFTNGCFDILHAGHVSYLEQARSTADCLIVGLNSDSSISRLKGPTRPVNREQDRARVLAALGCVDFIVLFADDTPLDLITALLPDVLVKGADWAEDDIVGSREVKAAGGRVERIAFQYDRSTTKVIEKIRR